MKITTKEFVIANKNRKRVYIMKKITIEVEENVFKKIEMKRNYAELGTNNFFIEAVNQYQPILKNNRICFECGNNMKESKDDVNYKAKVEEKEVEVTIKNFPVCKCQSCEESTINMKTYKFAKELVNDELKKDSAQLNDKTFDFNELLKIN